MTVALQIVQCLLLAAVLIALMRPRAKVEILHGKPGDWKPFTARPADHHDVQWALQTPGMAVRRRGWFGKRIEEGRQ